MKKSKLNDKKHRLKNGLDNPSATRPNLAEYSQYSDGKLPRISPSTPRKSEPKKKSPEHGEFLELDKNYLSIAGKRAIVYCITDKHSRAALAYHIEFCDKINAQTQQQKDGHVVKSMIKTIKERYKRHSWNSKLIPDNGPFKKPVPELNG